MLRPTVYLSRGRAAAFISLLVGACAPYPQRIHQEPVIVNNERVPQAEVVPTAGPAPMRSGSTVSDDARANAAQLIREGDDLVMANDLDGALNRYDRASVLDPEAVEVQYKAARLLDLQMRPKEAVMRYKRFLHGLDLERIKAQGEANAKLAEAVTIAQQRILVLEKQAP